MAMNFTVKEARQIIDRHKALLSKLERTIARSKTITSDIKQAADDFVEHAELRKLILNDLTSPSKGLKKNNRFNRFVHGLSKYQRASYEIETAKSYQDYADKVIKEYIDDLKPGIAGLSWMLGGKKAREKAELAYQALSDILDDSYAQDIPNFEISVNDALRIGAAEAWEEYCADPYLFRQAAEAVCPKIIKSGYDRLFRGQLIQLDSVNDKLAKCLAEVEEDKGIVRGYAEKVLASSALQILKNVPVDEISREKPGVRIKTLRDAGITTMADVYSSSVYQLASIHGISESVAYDIKKIARKFLTEAQGGAKIKLSADDRTKQATELIQALYLYRLKTPAREELDKIVQYKQELMQAKDVLVDVGNGVAWMFYSDEERQALRDAYAKLNGITTSEYAAAINRVTYALAKTNPVPSPNTAWNDFQQHSIEYISILEDIMPDVLGNDDNLYGLPEDLAREIQEEAFFPDGLLCTLRRYQEWGVKYILHQRKVLLGDEMGLGKTVQAIATMVSLRNTGATHFMVVCPASVVTNWCREIVKHSKLKATKIHGNDRIKALKEWIKTGGVAVTTFETTAHIKDDMVGRIDLVIVDEAHYIKNPEAQRSINVTRLCSKADRLLFMTGTALENKVDEMVSLINILQPNVASAVRGMTFMASAPQFRQRVAPVYYRRKREDVLTELPKLIETKEWCILNAQEKQVYEHNILARKFVASRRVSWDVDDLSQSSKAARLLEIIEAAKEEGRKVLVFSFFLDTIRAIGGLLDTRAYGPINGSVPVARRQEIIDDFDKAPAGSVLLAQIQSGGTGLNIQSASVVVICEPQMKPSIENQAISRAYRMGQARNVLVYRLLCENTIDEKITNILESKQEIFDAFADKSIAAQETEGRDTEIDEKKFGELIQEEIDRINSERKASGTT